MRTPTSMRLAVVAISLLLTACGNEERPNIYQSGGFKVSSPAFPPGGSIPKKYAQEPDGQNVSPPIEWSGAPAAAKAFALFFDSPDAGARGTFVHWIVWNIPGTARGLPEGVKPTAPDLVQGTNGFDERGYWGPKPPPGKTYKFVCSVYALDGPLSLPAGSTADKLVEAMKGHILANGRLVAQYP